MDNSTTLEKPIKIGVKVCLITSGQRLMVLLQKANLKQVELADKIGFSRQYINGIIKGRLIPSIDVMKKICSVLECDTRDIWRENDTK